MPKLFSWLQQEGGVADTEMYRVFNCGIGMVVVVDRAHSAGVAATLRSQGETVYELGQIAESGHGEPQTVVF